MAKQAKNLALGDSVALESDVAGKLDQGSAAPVFDDTVAYVSGYHVTYGGKLYRFTADHAAGAWTGTDVVEDNMTTPDATLDITSAGKLRVVAADGTIMWTESTAPVDSVNGKTGVVVLSPSDVGAASEAEALRTGKLDKSAVVAPSVTATTGLAADAKATGDALMLPTWYPDGSVTSVEQWTPMWDGSSGLKYSFDSSRHVAYVLPFCPDADPSIESNCPFSGAVIVPPYVVKDGVSYDVVGVDGVAEVNEYRDSAQITSIVLPSTVMWIDARAFFQCRSLGLVVAPGVTSVSQDAFRGTQSLASVFMPKVRYVDTDGFIGSGLSGFQEFPALSEVEEYGFAYTSLNAISLPAVTRVGDNAFEYCTDLASVDFGATLLSVPPLGSGAFAEVPATCKIIVPDSLYDAWIAASGWSDLVSDGYQFLKHSEWEYARRYEVQKVKDDLRYAITTKTPTVSSGTAAISLDDRTCNVSETTAATVSLTFPAVINGRARDFLLLLDTTGSSSAPTLAYASYMTIVADEDADLAPIVGQNLYTFTEVARNVFAATRTPLVTIAEQVPQDTQSLISAASQAGYDMTNVSTPGQLATALGLSASADFEDCVNKVMFG